MFAPTATPPLSTPPSSDLKPLPCGNYRLTFHSGVSLPQYSARLFFFVFLCGEGSYVMGTRICITGPPSPQSRFSYGVKSTFVIFCWKPTLPFVEDYFYCIEISQYGSKFTLYLPFFPCFLLYIFFVHRLFLQFFRYFLLSAFFPT